MTTFIAVDIAIAVAEEAAVIGAVAAADVVEIVDRADGAKGVTK